MDIRARWCVLVAVVALWEGCTALSRSINTVLISDSAFAVPLRKPAPTVTARLNFTINRLTKTCSLTAIDGRPRDFPAVLKFGEVFKRGCLQFKCKRRGLKLRLRKSRCEYGGQCRDSVAASEGRAYHCVKVMRTLVKTALVKGVIFKVTYDVFVGFSSASPVRIESTFSRDSGTCTVDGNTVNVGQSVAVRGLDLCAKVVCTKNGLKYLPDESACQRRHGDCGDSFTQACTDFTCLRHTFRRRSRDGHVLLVVFNSWLKLNDPSCVTADGQCVSLLGTVQSDASSSSSSSSSSQDKCTALVCLEGPMPGVPELLRTDTGCRVSVAGEGDRCVAVKDSVFGAVHVQQGEGGALCGQQLCRSDNDDPFRPSRTSLLVLSLGGCVDARGGCRRPGESWESDVGRCVCPADSVNNSQPDCVAS